MSSASDGFCLELLDDDVEGGVTQILSDSL